MIAARRAVTVWPNSSSWRTRLLTTYRYIGPSSKHFKSNHPSNQRNSSTNEDNSQEDLLREVDPTRKFIFIHHSHDTDPKFSHCRPSTPRQGKNDHYTNGFAKNQRYKCIHSCAIITHDEFCQITKGDILAIVLTLVRIPTRIRQVRTKSDPLTRTICQDS